MNDQQKQNILETLNHFRTTAAGISGIKRGIMDIRRYTKETYGMKQSEVAVALDYLIQNGWVEDVVEERTFTHGATTIPNVQSKYRLSAQGIAYFEDESGFNMLNRYQGLNISNIGGVVVVGNNNVVNNKYRDLFTTLDNLEKKIKLTSRLTDGQKLDASADVQTIKDQLSKDAPNKSVIDLLMTGLSTVADVAGVIDLWQHAHEMMQGLII